MTPSDTWAATCLLGARFGYDQSLGVVIREAQGQLEQRHERGHRPRWAAARVTSSANPALASRSSLAWACR